MVIVAQLVRASDCGSEGRGFETRLSPKITKLRGNSRLFLWFIFSRFGSRKEINIILNFSQRREVANHGLLT